MDVRIPIDLEQVAHALHLPVSQIEATLALLDAGNTVPFITRYRKDQTGGLDEEQIRAIGQRVAQLRLLAERKQTILRSIESQGKLNDELAARIKTAPTARVLEDLYLPYKPKKQTLGAIARQRGLEPLALEILRQERSATNLDARAADFVNPDQQIHTAAEALLGAGHLIAEWFSEHAELRRRLREIFEQTGVLRSQRAEGAPDLPAAAAAPAQGAPSDEAAKTESARSKERKARHEKLVHLFRDYFDFREAVGKIPPHRVLAINRGERGRVLRVRIEVDEAQCERAAEDILVPADHPHADFLRGCAKDAVRRLVLPSLERELRRELTDRAEDHGVRVFARNLRTLLLQPPLRGRRVLAIDPGFKSGCKIAALDEFGNPCATGVIHVIGKEEQRAASRAKLVEFIREHRISLIAIGNGAACRHAEELISTMLAEEFSGDGLAYVIVNEAGASVYSASPLGREELPTYDATLRGTISIGRRLQDPLSELVKIEPANIGVGMYQHDVKAKHLRETLDQVVESCVNFVGVELNTASPALLRYVSGLNQLTARRVYEYRQQHGPFKNREQLKQVPGFGEATYTQSAGFLKIVDGDNPLDGTWIHPESYAAAQAVLARLGFAPGALAEKSSREELSRRIDQLDRGQLAEEAHTGPMTLDDILANLVRPGRDPREDLPPPIFKRGITRLEDLSPGMELSGTVLNVVDFGAFVDIGLSDRGLIHVSQIAGRFISTPHEVVSVGDIVRVWVIGVDKDRRRVSLTMIPPDQRREHEKQGKEASREEGARRRRRRSRRPQAVTASEVAAAPTSPEARKPSKPPRERRRRPAPAVKLTAEMKEGKEPVRSFAALKQLLELRAQAGNSAGNSS
jgi:uncharacterized protein